MSAAWSWVKKWSLRLLWVTVAGALVGTAVLAIGYKRAVVDDESPHITEDYIRSVIARESPVLYADAETRIGVFFSQEHRQYVPFDDLPQHWVDAIVAAEDKHFFSHPGIDIAGIARAMVQNIKAGRVVSGGSTLTQQTAKNLYYRPDRSLRSKWDELLNALRLEHRYTKNDILAFYANQFHVSANGRGIGIAARYFFDKTVDELDLLECAFLAGMVKGPANYDPFVGRTEERRTAALERAKGRVEYVLGRLLTQEYITADERAAAQTELDLRFSEDRFFNQGQFRYDSHIILDEVEARLSEEPFPQLFQDLGIDNPSTAGIQIVTSIDATAQRESTYALWHHLTEVGPVLESWTVEDLAVSNNADRLSAPPEVHGFYHATVQRSATSGIELDVGGTPCTVDGDGISRMADVLARARRGERWRNGAAADREAVAAALSDGDVVFVSVREAGVCDLEIRPELQGAQIILQQGQIRAMVGGNDNRNFNRAIEAKRQLGSTWKPLIYDAALQLNWSPLDPLDNREGAFPFEGVWYYPRAAHTAPDTVSLAWAGTHSENLSSVWLLYHLTDHLDQQQFVQIAKQVGMTPGEGESASDFLVRMRDEYGIISTAGRIPELAWTATRLALFASLQETDPAAALAVQSMLYAGDAQREQARVERSYSGNDEVRRVRAIRNNPHHLGAFAQQCAAELEALHAVATAADEMLSTVNDANRPKLAIFGSKDSQQLSTLAVAIESLPEVSSLSHLFTAEAVEADEETGGETVSSPTLTVVCASEAPEGHRALQAADVDAIGRAALTPMPELVSDLSVEGDFTVEILDQLDRGARRRALVMAEMDPYSMEALQYHPDYRLFVGILYVTQLAERLGVETEIPPVMSIPLGAADITLEEAALVYQGLLTGQRHAFPGAGGVPPQGRNTLLIERILDQDGAVLYQAESAAQPVSDAVAGAVTAGVLHNVVEWGTGRRARGSVSVDGATVPLFGKTGTTNGFRNAAFCGYVPVWDGEDWSWQDGFTIATYVGYDDNHAMRRGSLRLAGSSGALPAWMGAAQGLAMAGLLGEPSTDAPWRPGEDFEQVAVAEGSGLPLTADEDPNGRMVWVWGERAPWSGDFSLQRRFSSLQQPVQAAAPKAPTPLPSAAPEFKDEDLDDVWIPEMEP